MDELPVCKGVLCSRIDPELNRNALISNDLVYIIHIGGKVFGITPVSIARGLAYLVDAALANHLDGDLLTQR